MRKVLFWLHLSAGVLAGGVILVMCVTGVLLMYERQIVALADRDLRSTPSGQRLDPETLVARVSQSQGAEPVAIALHSDTEAPAEITLPKRTVYADAYSGRVVGESSSGVRQFFRAVTDWHRWLAMQGPSRTTGKAITGAANLAFLLIVLGGMYLWIPRRWTRQNVRAVVWFRGGLSGKARDFNWHNSIGLWSSIPLIFVVLGSLVISYPWATNLLYTLTGSEPGATPAAGRTNGGRFRFAGLNDAWRAAEHRVPGWQSITFRTPPGDPSSISLSVAESHRGRPDMRSTVVFDRLTGRVAAHETFEGYSLGRRLRMYLRFVHTGELFGFAGQTIAGFASAGGAVLVWTGLALSLRRFRNWRSRRSTELSDIEQSRAA